MALNTNHAHTPVCVTSLSTSSSRPCPRPAAAPPPRRAVGAFGPSAAELQSRGRVSSIGVHQLGFAPYYPRTSVRGSGNLSQGTRRASRPAARQPATSIVGVAVGLPAQPSRVRSADLRPPLM